MEHVNMAKPNPLQNALNAKPMPPQPVAVATTKAARAVPEGKRPSRVGRVFVGGYFAPEVQTALKHIAADERVSMQDLFADALDYLFAKYHKPQIAKLPPKGQG
jgi:hypothetical protein